MSIKFYQKFVFNNIVNLIESKNITNKIYKELNQFLNIVNTSPSFKKFIKLNKIYKAKKVKILYSILQSSEFSIDFIKIILYLADVNFLHSIEDFLYHCKLVIYKTHFVYQVTVPYQLSQEEQNRIKNFLSQKEKTKLQKDITYQFNIEWIINPKIIGGIIIYNKNNFTLLDLSILSKINRLKTYYGNK